MLFYLQIWSFFGLLGLFLRWTFKSIFLLVSFKASQLFLNSSPFFSHLLSVLLVEQRKLTAAYGTKTQYKYHFADEIVMMLMHPLQKQTLTWSLHLSCCVCVNKRRWRQVCVQSRNAHTPCRPRRKTCDKFSTFVLLQSSCWWQRTCRHLCESLWKGHSLQHTNTQRFQTQSYRSSDR